MENILSFKSVDAFITSILNLQPFAYYEKQFIALLEPSVKGNG